MVIEMSRRHEHEGSIASFVSYTGGLARYVPVAQRLRTFSRSEWRNHSKDRPFRFFSSLSASFQSLLTVLATVLTCHRGTGGDGLIQAQIHLVQVSMRRLGCLCHIPKNRHGVYLYLDCRDSLRRGLSYVGHIAWIFSLRPLL